MDKRFSFCNPYIIKKRQEDKHQLHFKNLLFCILSQECERDSMFTVGGRCFIQRSFFHFCAKRNEVYTGRSTTRTSVSAVCIFCQSNRLNIWFCPLCWGEWLGSSYFVCFLWRLGPPEWRSLWLWRRLWRWHSIHDAPGSWKPCWRWTLRLGYSRDHFNNIALCMCVCVWQCISMCRLKVYLSVRHYGIEYCKHGLWPLSDYIKLNCMS